MGISANQARLLSLTARKCDLETQMQVILNNKLRIAQQTSNIANDYSDATSNRRLFIFKPSSNVNTSVYEDLSASNLYNSTGLMLARKTGADTYEQINTNDKDSIEEGLRNGTYFIVKEADMTTQDPHTIDFTTSDYAGGGVLSGDVSGDWEIIDWRTSTFNRGSAAGDHGSLSGLSDDDHLQYHTDARGDLRYASLTDFDELVDRNNVEACFNAAYDEAYHELTYSSGDITNVDVWDTDAKVTKLFSKVINYDGDNIDEVIITDEVSSKVLTKTITYDVDGNIETVTKVLT